MNTNGNEEIKVAVAIVAGLSVHDFQVALAQPDLVRADLHGAGWTLSILTKIGLVEQYPGAGYEPTMKVWRKQASRLLVALSGRVSPGRRVAASRAAREWPPAH